MKKIYTLSIILFCCVLGYSQDGMFNVRFNLKSIDCNHQKVYADIEIQANNANSEFLLSDQNYRFNFNKDAINPIDPPIIPIPGGLPETLNPNDRTVHIDSMFLSGFVVKDNTFSFFNDYTLLGSIDSIVSVNIVLSGGDGYPIYHNEWTRIAQLRFNYIDNGSPIRLQWHDQNTFPPTYVGQKLGGVKLDAAEGLYLDLTLDPALLCGNPLPIELESFVGLDRGCQVELKWTTATETNNDYFVIEESANGFSFKELARIDGAGNSTDAISYSYFDEDVEEGNYYRLKQVDFDGTSSTSSTIYVRSSCYDDEPLSVITDVFPNPVKPGKPLKVSMFSNKEASAEVVISDLLGRRLNSEQVEMVAGPNLFRIDVSRLAMGTYFVEVITSDTQSVPFKFVKTEQ